MKNIAWLASYPKSGNTWTRSFLRAYQYDAFEPIRLNQIGRISKSDSRLTHFQAVAGKPGGILTDEEINALRPKVQEDISREIGVHQVAKTHNARFTIDGIPLIQDQFTRKAVYLVRNPLDVVDSLADHNSLSIDQTIDTMNNPEHIIGAAQEVFVTQYIGTWSEHVRSWTEATEFPVLVLKYEDLLADPVGKFGELLAFLGWYFDQERLQRAVQLSSFDVLQQSEQQQGFEEVSHRSRSGRFFRRGQADAWKQILTPPQITRILSHHAETMQAVGYEIPSTDPLALQQPGD